MKRSGKEFQGEGNSVAEFTEQIDSTLKQLANFTYARKLKQLDSSIDTSQFVSDEDYRKETIFELVRSESDENYDTALSLATHYAVPKRQLYFVYLAWILTESTSSSSVFPTKLDKRGTPSHLLENPSELSRNLQESVYPRLPGCDLGRLCYYYTLLQSCEERGAKIKLKLHSPETHVRLLKKLRTSVQGLDYKQLMLEEGDSEAILRAAISSANGHVLAKMAGKFPYMGDFMTECVVYRILCEKLFWKDTGWIDQYEACQEFMERLDGENLKAFVMDAVASLRAIEEVALHSRIEIAKRAVRFARQRVSGKEKSGRGFSDEDLRSTVEELNFVLKHVRSLNESLLSDWANSENENERNYAVKYDRALGDHAKVLALAQTLLMDGNSVETIKSLIDLAETVSGRKTTARHVMATTVEKLLDDLKKPDFDKETMRKLICCIESVAKHIKADGQLVKGDALLSILRPFCGNLDLPIEPRTAVLQTLEQNLDLGESEASLLTFYKSEATVSSAWTRKISPADVEGSDAQFRLLHELIQESSQLHQFKAIWKLIVIWSTETRRMASLVLPLVAKLDDDEGSSYQVLEMRKEVHDIDLEVDKEVFFLLKDQDLAQISAVKYGLITIHPQLHKLSIESLKEAQEVSSDDELSELLILRSQVVSLLQSSYYDTFIEYLTTSGLPVSQLSGLQNVDPNLLKPGKERIEWIARQLYDAGFWAQAGSLLLKQKKTNSIVSTFNLALSAAKKLFGK